MAFSIVYKKIFDIRIIHPFFLRDESYFVDGQEHHLEEVEYDISNHIEIEPTLNCQELMDGHRMVYRKTSTGLAVWVEAIEKSSGEFSSLIPIDSDTTFSFAINTTNSKFDNFSNTRLNPNIKCAYYFDNYRDKISSDAPSLSRAPSNSFNRKYEMGEIINGNQIAKKDTIPGSGDWDTIVDYYQYVTYNDRLLVSSTFNYSFNPISSSTVTDPVFILFDESGVEVTRIEITGNTILSNKFLDFSEVPFGRYRLVVQAINYSDEKDLFINDDLFDDSSWGIIEINNKSNTPEFQLLDANDNLQTPIFEIRLFNRPTYWKYFLNQWDIDNGTLGSTAELEFIPPDCFKSFEPIRLSRFATPLTVGGTATPLPVPYNFNIKPYNENISSEIYLPKLNL